MVHWHTGIHSWQFNLFSIILSRYGGNNLYIGVFFPFCIRRAGGAILAAAFFFSRERLIEPRALSGAFRTPGGRGLMSTCSVFGSQSSRSPQARATICIPFPLAPFLSPWPFLSAFFHVLIRQWLLSTVVFLYLLFAMIEVTINITHTYFKENIIDIYRNSNYIIILQMTIDIKFFSNFLLTCFSKALKNMLLNLIFLFIVLISTRM